ncbi:unnamed protein product [Amoebophrya sp. A120]|nr:unnamed protein product [Amoebophrya sp. A120]|eukprot:GSA120T00011199001.1
MAMQTSFDHTRIISGSAPVQPPVPNYFNQALAGPTTAITPVVGLGGPSGSSSVPQRDGPLMEVMKRNASATDLDRTQIAPTNYRVDPPPPPYLFSRAGITQILGSPRDPDGLPRAPSGCIFCSKCLPLTRAGASDDLNTEIRFQ